MEAKSILLSVKPEWVAKILNREKTIEIRKKFPKDYVGWVYIYCSKGKNNSGWVFNGFHERCDGKVVARFWCDEAEEIRFNGYFCPNDNEYTTPTKNGIKLMKLSCISLNELVAYFDGKHKDTIVGKAIHISKLEIFDKPRELNEFKKRNELEFWQWNAGWEPYSTLTKAPQNYCYIESEK